MKTLSTPLNVILVDDHQILLDGMQSLIENEKDIHLVGTFLQPAEVLSFLNTNNQNVDIAVLDVNMHFDEAAGIKLCQKIKERFPHIAVLILSMFNTQKFITPLLKAGADGYILKEKGSEELVKALYTLGRGQEFFSTEIVKTVMDVLANRIERDHGSIQLTSREIDVLRLLGKGLTSKQVAHKLCIEKSTVETHKNHIREKLDLKNLKEIIIFARENGYSDDY